MSTPNLLQQGVLVQDKQYYSPNTHITERNLFAAGIRKDVPMDDLGLVKTWTQIFRNVQPLYNFDQIAKKSALNTRQILLDKLQKNLISKAIFRNQF